MLSALLDAIAAWAALRPDIAAVALVGSQARGEAGPGSDVDLVIVTERAASYIVDTAWLGEFPSGSGLAAPQSVQVEDYGLVTSLRVNFSGGSEVEFGFAAPSWAEPPVDPGTLAVVKTGMRILHDPQGLLQRMRQSL